MLVARLILMLDVEIILRPVFVGGIDGPKFGGDGKTQ